MSDTDTFEDIHELLDRETLTWDPEPGDAIVGILRATSRRTSAHTENYPVLTIEPEDGSTWVDVHAWHHVLWDEYRTQAPLIGDAIGIRFLGKAEGKSYMAFKVVIMHRSAPGTPVELAAALDDAPPGEVQGEGTTPVESPGADDPHDELAALCELAMLRPAGAINTACGGRYTATDWRRASLEEVARTRAWLEQPRRPR